jgi:tRNA pseudouridine38-40 synthase
MRVLLKLQFKGTNYHGFQKQKNALTIQNILESALEKIHKMEIKIVGCSRTDAFVSAQEFYCHFDVLDNTINYTKALNSFLPKDIHIKEHSIVSDDFHARFSALGKEYIYTITNEFDVFNFDVTELINYSLNISLMEEAIKLIIGEHSFYAFTDDIYLNYHKTIFKAEIILDKPLIMFRIVGNSFLRYMVRTLVGTIVQVGLLNISIEEFKNYLDQETIKSKYRLGGKGLTLQRVFYTIE